MALDSAENAFVTGSTQDGTFPTVNPLFPSNNLGGDMLFVSGVPAVTGGLALPSEGLIYYVVLDFAVARMQGVCFYPRFSSVIFPLDHLFVDEKIIWGAVALF
ncbi:MAG: hypothetical protein ABSF54_06345 [Bryobacteraceae bacterium]